MARILVKNNSSRKDMIVKKAAYLFKTKGFKATSMRHLADALNIEAPSLYNHIISKNELLQDVCFKVADYFTAHLTKVETEPGTMADKIESIIRFHIKMMLENFDEVYVANHEWKYLKEPFLASFLNQRRSYEKKLIILIEKGIQRKEFKKHDAYIAVLTILSAVRGLEFWQRNKKNISAKILEDTMVNQLLSGIKK